jgi:hypothetical protein
VTTHLWLWLVTKLARFEFADHTCAKIKSASISDEVHIFVFDSPIERVRLLDAPLAADSSAGPLVARHFMESDEAGVLGVCTGSFCELKKFWTARADIFSLYRFAVWMATHKRENRRP